MRELFDVEKSFGCAEEGLCVNTSYAYRLCVSLS